MGQRQNPFYKKIVEENNGLSSDKEQKDNWLYISLNGIDTVQEIESRIRASIYASYDKLKFASTTLGRIVSSTSFMGVKLDSKAIDKGISNIFEKITPKLKNAVLVFDDIERCSLPLSSIFGFISNFVEHDNLKVIVVTDEEKLKEHYAKEASTDDRGFDSYE